MKSLYLQIPGLHSSGSRLVLATVTSTRGSTPQKPGSSALFGEKGLIAGTVGGGIVEGKIQNIARQALLSGNSGLYHFNLANDISKAEEAICGGQISVLVDADVARSVSVFRQLQDSLSDRIPGVLITMVTGSSDTGVRIDRSWVSDSITPSLPAESLKKIEPEVKALIMEKDPAGFRGLDLGSAGEKRLPACYLQPFFPPDQLVIAGAGHIGRSLAHLGNLLGFEVIVIDDRAEYANIDNIPDADHIIVNNIGVAMGELEKGENTFVVIVTRGHKDDAAALKPCIGMNLKYTGMIGSRNKIAAMKLNFIENKWATAEQWDKIHAPVGLSIKSQTVEEIAVSIAAELIQVRNSRK